MHDPYTVDNKFYNTTVGLYPEAVGTIKTVHSIPSELMTPPSQVLLNLPEISFIRFPMVFSVIQKQDPLHHMSPPTH